MPDNVNLETQSDVFLGHPVFLMKRYLCRKTRFNLNVVVLQHDEVVSLFFLRTDLMTVETRPHVQNFWERAAMSLPETVCAFVPFWHRLICVYAPKELAFMRGA